MQNFFDRHLKLVMYVILQIVSIWFGVILYLWGRSLSIKYKMDLEGAILSGFAFGHIAFWIGFQNYLSNMWKVKNLLATFEWEELYKLAKYVLPLSLAFNLGLFVAKLMQLF